MGLYGLQEAGHGLLQLLVRVRVRFEPGKIRAERPRVRIPLEVAFNCALESCELLDLPEKHLCLQFGMHMLLSLAI